MNQYELTTSQKKSVEMFLSRYSVVQPLVESLIKEGAHVYLVGGAVRDIIMGKDPQDYDIEVHGISAEKFECILRLYGHVNYVGKSFGVYRLEQCDIDWSLPRKDSCGRKPDVHIDPYMSLEDALRRRDLTMNACALDMQSHIVYDPFNGLLALQQGMLSTPDVMLFVQDPLRLFRVMHFIGRFEMQPDQELENVCKTMDLSGISRERIEAECEKLLLLSRRPSLGFRWICKIGRLHELFPELAATCDVPQSPVWHPEGDVFEHSMQALDAAAALRGIGEQRLILLYAALMHDLGKPETTKILDGKITSYEHEVVGVEKARALLKRITHNNDVVATVSVLVRNHMYPGAFVKQNAGAAAYKRLAVRLAPYATLELLSYVAYADHLGRNGKGHEPLTGAIESVDAFRAFAQKYGVYQGLEEPVLTGRDFLDVVKPGPELGKLVRRAYEIQINEGIIDKDVLKQRACHGILKKK